MPQPSKLNLPPIDLGGESLGQRIKRIRKERGFTPVELAEKIGVIQSIVSERIGTHVVQLRRYEAGALQPTLNVAACPFWNATEFKVSESFLTEKMRSPGRRRDARKRTGSASQNTGRVRTATVFVP